MIFLKLWFHNTCISFILKLIICQSFTRFTSKNLIYFLYLAVMSTEVSEHKITLFYPKIFYFFSSVYLLGVGKALTRSRGG